METVIANGITDQEKISKLTEFAKKHDAVIENVGKHNMCVKCKDLKTAKMISQKLLSLK